MVMSRRLTALALAGCLLAVLPAAANARVTARSKLSTAGLGTIKVGMTKAQAERAGGIRLVYQGPAMHGCRYIRPRNRYIRASFMLIRGRIVRTDVWRRGIRTVSGVRVGDSEASVRRRFAGRLRITPHAYTNGRYLEFIPRDRVDRNRRVIFETTNGRVSAMRAGRLPEVRYIEGCA